MIQHIVVCSQQRGISVMTDHTLQAHQPQRLCCMHPDFQFVLEIEKWNATAVAIQLWTSTDRRLDLCCEISLPRAGKIPLPGAGKMPLPGVGKILLTGAQSPIGVLFCKQVHSWVEIKNLSILPLSSTEISRVLHFFTTHLHHRAVYRLLVYEYDIRNVVMSVEIVPGFHCARHFVSRYGFLPVTFSLTISE